MSFIERCPLFRASLQKGVYCIGAYMKLHPVPSFDHPSQHATKAGKMAITGEHFHLTMNIAYKVPKVEPKSCIGVRNDPQLQEYELVD